MELCPRCKTGLYLKRTQEDERGRMVVKTCRNPSCGNYLRDVSAEWVGSFDSEILKSPASGTPGNV